MKNNFDLVRKMLDFGSSDTYYFLQILKRRKDNPDLGKDMKVIGDYFIYSMEQFNRMEDEIIQTCVTHNARAYFRINKRSSKKTAMQMLKRVTDLIISENYKEVKNAFSSVSGEFHGDEDKKWIVDIDDVSIDTFNHSKEQIEIRELIYNLQLETGKEPMMKFIPTKSGIHIITRPFNLKNFKEKYPDVDVHKDNMVILYLV
jgi:hypothetical protein